MTSEETDVRSYIQGTFSLSYKMSVVQKAERKTARLPAENRRTEQSTVKSEILLLPVIKL